MFEAIEGRLSTTLAAPRDSNPRLSDGSARLACRGCVSGPGVMLRSILGPARGSVTGLAPFVALTLMPIDTGHRPEPQYALRSRSPWAVTTPQQLQPKVDCVQILLELAPLLVAASPDIWYDSRITLTRQPWRARRLTAGLMHRIGRSSSTDRKPPHLTGLPQSTNGQARDDLACTHRGVLTGTRGQPALGPSLG